MNKIVEAILQRRSIRKYQDKAVEKEKLVILLQAAMAAPAPVITSPGNLWWLTNLKVWQNSG